MSASDEVLDRITKLLSLSRGSSGPEAELAAERAAELMAKYEVEAAEVEAHTDFGKPPPVERGRLDDLDDRPPARSFQGWKGALAKAIATSLNGVVLKQPYRDGTHTILMFGPQNSVRAGRYVFMMLVKELERLVRVFLRETGGRGPQGNAYLWGAVTRLRERLSVGRATSLALASSQALAVIDKTTQRVQALYEETGPKGKVRATLPTDGNAFEAGYEKAGDLDIDQQHKQRLGDGPKALES